MKIAIIGAGIAGLTAAYDLVRKGHEVVCFEAAESVGGLAGGFKAPHWDWSLEYFYHHWFYTDTAIHKLADDLGVRDKILYPKPVTALYHKGSFYPFDSPLAVLKFPGIPFIDRVRFGMVGAYLKFSRSWKSLEKHTAHEWMNKWLGARAYKALWEPMLEGKFGPEYYKQVNMAWFWARIHARTPRLGTFVGGFQAFLDALAEGVRKEGGQIRLQTPVQSIEQNTDGGLDVRTDAGSEHYDKVLSTTSPGLLSRMVPDLPGDYLAGLKTLKSLGAAVLTVSLDRPLGPGIYWYNLPKSEGFPILCLVEHTAFVSPEHYGGDHIIYLGDYVDKDHPYMKMSKDELLEKFQMAMTKINPDFSPDWIKDSWLHRAAYAQPVPMLEHSKNIPDTKTPIKGLYWGSMSHIYPWDRGTNFAAELGHRIAGEIMNSA
jgi:protoporphyrinogen oxidase